MEDVTPELLQKIKKQFKDDAKDNKVLVDLVQKIDLGKADYIDANKFAIEIGNILAKSMQDNLSSFVLPDGKMYYNIASQVLNDTLKNNHKIISDYSRDVQELLNKQAKIGIKPQVSSINQDRIDGLVNRISSEDDFDKSKWLLDDPIVNFSQSIVDDSIEANVKFHHESGLNPRIVRKIFGKPCKWCSNLAGEYNYPNVPKDIYKRHERCRCMVNYIPKDGKKQDVWSKQWF